MAIFDILDWEWLPLRNEQDYRNYQVWDKVWDSWGLMILAVYMWRKWTLSLGKKVGLGLLGWRLIGVLAFSLLRERWLLFVFANLFETYFLAQELYRQKLVAKGKKQRWLPLPVLGVFAIFKLVQEFWMHVVGKMPWQSVGFSSFGNWDVYLSMAEWVGVYVGLQVLTFWWFITKEVESGALNAITPKRE